MRKIIAANWKMNKLRAEASQTAKELKAGLAKELKADREVFIFPPFLAIEPVAETFKDGSPKVVVGAQNFYPVDHGAYTGEVALPMLKDCGASFVLIGHSERRQIFHESDAFIAQKTSYALQNKMGVMLCIGETLAEREQGELRMVLERQLVTALTADLLKNYTRDKLSASLIIAYEPVWAIGTGKVAGPNEVLEAHAMVKDLLKGLSQDVSYLPVLYGGSVKPSNAAQLLGLQNVDGLLVGGASLEAESFLQIINA
ncbi:MAG: triose-phosphate isomerase [Desulfovibrionaceae bacterium]|nr:triose-phosphate isomerase [Desulfovibrionaceae bacterium]